MIFKLKSTNCTVAAATESAVIESAILCYREQCWKVAMDPKNRRASTSDKAMYGADELVMELD